MAGARTSTPDYEPWQSECVPSELGGTGSDRPREPHEAQETRETRVLGRTAEEREAWAEDFREKLAEIDEQTREKKFEAAADRRQTRGQWEKYEELRDEDNQQSNKLEAARADLCVGPPDGMGGKDFTPEPKKTEFYEKARSQESEALEHFRKEPAEGPDNKPIDPERVRPIVRWYESEPPIPPGDLKARDAVVYVRPERRDWQDPSTGLRKPDATPDSRLSPEEHQEKIDVQRGNAAEVMGAERWSNSKYAGRVFEVSEDLRDRFPDGVQFSDEGFPQFDRYSAKTVVFEEGFRGPRKQDDFARANAVFGWKRVPEGMVWHHTEDGCSMVLIDRDLHDEVRHWGGVRASKQMGLWEGE